MKLSKLLVLLTTSLFALASHANNITFSAPKTDNDTVHFAVIGDLTGGERNGVFDVAVKQLIALQPDFIVSIGDLIEGGTEDINQLNHEWAQFSNNINQTNVPFYPVVGNHDISNVVQRKWWEQNIGPRYYHFRHKDILFLMLDSEDYTDQRFDELADIRMQGIEIYKKSPKDFKDSEYANLAERKWGEVSQQQTDYFIDVIEQNKDVRWTFILMHKPIWEAPKGHNFFKIEQALSEQPYSMLAGHVHTYNYTKRFGRDYVQLGTTGGAFVPADKGEYMDHIMWFSINKDGPKALNLELTGMKDIEGKLPFSGKRPCFANEKCK